MRRIERLFVEGFLSIQRQHLALEDMNVFIGANGSGKSNLIKAFQMLQYIASGRLQTYVGVNGGADRLLHFGRQRTERLTIGVEFTETETADGYEIRLVPTSEDTFVVAEEIAVHHNRATGQEYSRMPSGSGHKEAMISDAYRNIPVPGLPGFVRQDLLSYRIYHFHDVGPNAKVKQTSDIEDCHFLRSDASNLGAFLYFLERKHPRHFAEIVEVIRLAAPFFDGFNLAPSRLNPDKIRLEWKDKHGDGYFNAHDLSDGTLRFICLATLLLQPQLPAVILLDEPELGLHPAALNMLVALMEKCTLKTQILAVTQSVTLINQLEPSQVWIAEQQNGATEFHHPAQCALELWLDEFALGELWEKNVLGGRP